MTFVLLLVFTRRLLIDLRGRSEPVRTIRPGQDRVRVQYSTVYVTVPVAVDNPTLLDDATHTCTHIATGNSESDVDWFENKSTCNATRHIVIKNDSGRRSLKEKLLSC